MGRMKFVSKTDKVFYRVDREKRMKEQNNKCYCCGCRLKRNTVTADHYEPLSKVNRMHHPDNVVAACENCNTRKGSMDAEEFYNDWFNVYLRGMTQRMDDRLKLAEYRLDLNPKGGGSFNKWKAYWEKRGRWD